MVLVDKTMPNCLLNLRSLHDFEAYRDVPEAFAYIVYSVVKLLICIAYAVVATNKYCCQCCNCSRYCYCIANKVVYWFWEQGINLVYVIVGGIFGAPLGVVERAPDEYERTHGYTADQTEQQQNDNDQVAACLLTVCVPCKKADEQNINGSTEMQNASCTCKHGEPEITNSGIEPLYIHGNKLETNEVLVLAAVIIPFLVAIVTTFWDRYSLEETYSCTEDPEIYCFPLAIAPTTNDELNISHHSPKVNDCSIWTTSGISANVTFRCFKCANNLQDALAALGGLLSIFKIAIKMGFFVLLFITAKFIKLMVYCRCSPQNVRLYFKRIRIFFVLLLTGLEASFGLAIGVAYARHRLTYGTLTDHNSSAYKLFEHLNEPLVVIGIIITSLLLPLENYLPVQEKANYERLSGHTDQPLEPSVT